MRIGSLLGLTLFMQLAAVPAIMAGDVAELEILGFSTDGGVFAFEEYGVLDGSGFPYSYRYYIDTDADKYLPKTPIRVRMEDEAATVAEARALSLQRGEKIISDATLARNPGFTAGFNPVTELSADPFRMEVNPRPIFHPVDQPLEFRLQEFPLIVPERCQSLGDIVGYRLLRIDAKDGGQTRLLHEDKTIPLSRGCPVGYQLGGVQTFRDEGGSSAYAVLIAVRQYGFEGPDFRWIAVTGRW